MGGQTESLLFPVSEGTMPVLENLFIKPTYKTLDYKGGTFSGSHYQDFLYHCHDLTNPVTFDQNSSAQGGT
jgi:hypothetical protein